MKKYLSKQMRCLMSLLLVICMIFGAQATAFAAIPASKATPTKCATITTAKTPVYIDSNYSCRGAAKSYEGTVTKYDAYIEGTDTFEILKTKDSAAYVRYYTTSGSARYGWIRTSAVTSATSLPTAKKAKVSLATSYCYNRPNGSANFGSISAGDNIWLLSTSGSWYQVRFNLGSASSPTGYRIAWITKANYEKVIGTSTGSSVTAQAALAWCQSKVGTKVGSGQCVALVAAYYNYLGVNSVSGNACDYSTNALPSGWTRVKGGTPQPGDILVYTGGKYGHVAIYAGGTTIYHQNWNGLYVEKATNWNYNKSWYSKAEGGTKSYWGYIRPKF